MSRTGPPPPVRNAASAAARTDVAAAHAEAARAVAARARRGAWRRAALGLAVPVLLLAAWESAARAGAVDTVFFPAPTRIAARTAALASSGELGTHTAATLWRLLPGYALGAATGALAGFVMGVSRTLSAAFGPLFSALYAVPKIATLPLLLLVFGLTETPRVLSVAVTVFFVLQINTAAGVRQIDPRLLESARAYGASGLRLLRFVLVPGALPGVLTGLRTATGLSVVVVVAVEFVASERGLGYLIWNSWTLFQPDRMYAGLMCVALLGAVFSGAVSLAGRAAMPWRSGRRTGSPASFFRKGSSRS
ncbi:ABC transporter permease [Streptomyces sp. HNM0575]|uniref:ABC transporter permease n=1 Tax=Streptomyces sp. HNM0575 TaxID=2716338 RepID=UPI00145F9FF5|nr:ABC transporter permease [Streptomyces sp. HNM0575]NLU71496.1 ABC transporter permease [Streptomyces sp. HNM0575]